MFALYSLSGLYYGLLQSKLKRNVFGLSQFYLPLGAFVWGDAAVFGAFWVLLSLTAYFYQSWTLFLLMHSLFWVVRSVGETIYWFLQQFSTVIRHKPETSRLHHIFHDDSIWFIYHIFWQCITVISILFTIYFACEFVTLPL